MHCSSYTMGISDKPWSAAGDGVARHDAMVCFVSVRVATESDRKIDLSQRVS